MKKLFYIFLMLFFIPISVLAETKTITSYNVNDSDGINLRSGPGTNYSILVAVSNNIELEYIETVASGNGCNDAWYKVKVYGYTGYACSTYISKSTRTVQAISETDFNKSLLNFPESYRSYLIDLHNAHPSWNFVALNTGLDWNDVVANESVKGRSLIYYSYGEGYRSKESYSYSYETDTYTRHPSEPNWWYASKEAVAYYLDPRNYLNSSNIFSFESLSYESFQTAEVVSKMMDNSFMPNVYSKYSSDHYTKAFMDAASKYDVSPLHIASLILQEQGINGSVASSGAAFTYNGVTYSSIFNFFNIKAYGTGAVYNGLVWAAGGTSYGRPWNTPYKCIMGGAQFLSEDYIAIGQNTLYFEKFDVSRTNGKYTHQYQTNITAPLTEGHTNQSTYSKISGLTDSSFVFIIPVYNNMPTTAVTAPLNKNSNPYLKDIKINNTSISNFYYTTLNYNYPVSSSTRSVTISATTINSKATITGAGTIQLVTGTNTVNLTVKAEDGTTKTYTITITKPERDPNIEVNDLLDNSGVKYNNEIIYGINIGTNVDSLTNNIINYNSLATVTIKDKSGNVKANSNFVTGDTVTLTGTNTKQYTVVIYGDINGDGEIDKRDSLAILRDYYGYSKLSGVYKTSADINNDGKIDKIDSLAVLRDYYGYAKISQ